MASSLALLFARIKNPPTVVKHGKDFLGPFFLAVLVILALAEFYNFVY